MLKELIRRIAWLNSRGIKSEKCIFDKFPDPSIFQCWTTRVKTEVCSCSNFLNEAMLWIKGVEMVGLVDDLETSRSIGWRA